MKKLFPIVFLPFLLMTLTSSSLAFDGEIKFGKYFNAPEQAEHIADKFYNSVEVGHQIKFLRPYLLFETCMEDFMIDYKIDPSSTSLTAGLELKISDNFILDLKHMYFHPIENGVVEEYDYAGVTFKF